METVSKYISITFGIVCCLYAVWGMLFVLLYAAGLLTESLDQLPGSFSYATYSAMAACNFLLCIGLFVIGIFYLNKKTDIWYALPLLLLAQYGYHQFIYSLWNSSSEKLAMSVAAATGVTGGGSVIQEQTYFWIWGAALSLLLWRIPPAIRPATDAPDRRTRQPSL